MRAEVDCVAITDHNTADWIDRLREEYAKLVEEGPEGLRELHLFPGVEITVDGGIHLLGVFDPKTSGDDIREFLGAADLKRNSPDPSRHRTSRSLLQVSRLIVEHDGLAVPAHADRRHGVLTNYSGESLKEILTCKDILAAEVLDRSKLDSGPARHHQSHWTAVLGSDSHHPSGDGGSRFPGSHFTWIKMGRPSIEGLSLALLDGAPLSVQRSDDCTQDPNSDTGMVIRSLDVSEGKFAGRGTSLEAQFSPWMTAIIGGRGTGKSTLVEMMRLCLRRDHEVPEDLRSDLSRFARVPKSRSDAGALTENTRVALIIEKDGISYRLNWDESGSMPAIERQLENGSWHPSDGDIRNRFPVAIFSQKQILSLANDRSSILQLIDDSDIVDGASIADQKNVVKAKFLRLKSQIRELNSQLQSNLRSLGDMEDVNTKINLLEQGGHRKTLIAFRRIKRQSAVIDDHRDDISKTVQRIRELAEDSEPLEIREEHFDIGNPSELSALEWVREAASAQLKSADQLRNLATDLENFNDGWESRFSEDYSRLVEKVKSEYVKLLQKLSGVGIENPGEYSTLLQRRQILNQRSRESDNLRLEIKELKKDAIETLSKLNSLRLDLSDKRQKFLENMLQSNPYVRITLVPFGDEPVAQEAAFRKAISREDGRLESDILTSDASGGILARLYRNLPNIGSGERTAEIVRRIRRMKDQIDSLGSDNHQPKLTKWFKNHIRDLSPEQRDRIEVWQPSDSLRIEYQRPDESGWSPIQDGSPGQKSAALLAFFLSYGRIPIILDQPEDDLDNHLIYDLIVRQIRESKRNRQIIVVTHNPNIVVNGDAEAVIAMDFLHGQCVVVKEGTGCLQEQGPRKEVCRVMEGGLEAFESRYKRLAIEVLHAD